MTSLISSHQSSAGRAIVTSPLTHAQESLYFLQKLTRDEPVYNMPQAFRLRGELNVDALRKSVDLLVARHDALRARVIEEKDGPVQVIDSPSPATFRVHNAELG